MPKKRFYDTLTDEDIDIFGFFADRVVLLLYQRMLHWKILFNAQSATTRETSRMVAWTLYRESREKRGVKNPGDGYIHPKSPEQIVRSRLVKEILNEILPESLQGEDYVDACRKTLSIMSVRTWEERKRREALKKTEPPRLLVKQVSHSLSARRERWRTSLSEIPALQSEIPLRGAMSGVHETPIATLPPQTTPLPRHEPSHEVTLVMPVIMADADFEQRRVTTGGYTPPARYFKKRRQRLKVLKAYPTD